MGSKQDELELLVRENKFDLIGIVVPVHEILGMLILISSEPCHKESTIGKRSPGWMGVPIRSCF